MPASASLRQAVWPTRRLSFRLLDTPTRQLHAIPPSTRHQQPLAETVQVDGNEHDDASHYQLLGGVDVHQPQPLAGHAQDENTDHRADQIPFAPGQTDPAENGRGDHDQLEALDTRVEIAGPRLRCHEYS